MGGGTLAEGCFLPRLRASLVNNIWPGVVRIGRHHEIVIRTPHKKYQVLQNGVLRSTDRRRYP